jgi:hypothetical protein
MLYTYAEGKLLDSSERPLKGTPTKMGVLTIEGDFDKDYFTIYSHALGMHVTLFSGDYASIDRWIKQLVMEKKLEK